MMDLKEKVTNKLKEYGIESFKEFNSDGEDIMMAEDFTVSCNKNDLFVCFHIIARPSYAGRIILILKEIEGINEFFIGDDFVFDVDGKFLEGDEAYEHHKTILKKMTISKFIEEQTQLYLLNKAKSFHC
jgi:hypothetical protein